MLEYKILIKVLYTVHVTYYIRFWVMHLYVVYCLHGFPVDHLYFF